MLSPYLEYISTNESSKKKLKDIASLLSNSLFRFNDPIINSSHSKINHPKSSFFQFLSKTKGIPSNDIAFLNYPDVYSLFAEYLTFLANDWTSYSSLKILKFDFDFDKLAKSITNQNDLEKYKSNHLDFFNDFISLTSNKEKIKSELIKDYIESLELSFNEKLSHLTIKIKSKENAKNEYQFNQIEYILDLKNKKDITLDFLKPKIELNLQTIKNHIKNLSAFRFIDYITKYPNWIINESSKYINSSFLTGDPNLDKFLRGELKEAKITYDLDTFYSSNGKTLKFNIKSINYDFGTFIIDDLIFLGDLFENIKSDYFYDNKSIIEINLFNEINLKKDYISESLSLSSLKEIITNKLTTFLKEKGFNYEDYKNNLDSVITEEITTKLISDQSSIKKKQQDFVEISLSLDSSSLDKKDLSSNKLYFRFTNIKPFDFKDLKLSDVILNINTIFSEAYTDFEYEVRYKNLIKQLKEEISTNLLNQFKENNNNIGNNYLPEDFISNKKNEGYIFNFEFIPYYLKTKEIELLNKDYDERNEILNKHLEDLFYGLRKINLGITIPSYLKQYYLNSDNFNITVRNHSYLVKLVDFSNIKNEIDKSLEIKYPNWKNELNNKYKSTFKDFATKLGISEDKINLTEPFLNPPKIEIIEAFKNNESILTGEINKKVTLLTNKLKNKVFDNNQFLVVLAEEILKIYASYINTFIKQKIAEYTKIINPAYNEIFFDIYQFVSPETKYSFSYNKLFNFLIQDVDFSTVKSIDSLIKNEIEHITKKINIIPSLDADGKPKYGFNDFETSLNISINKNILFEMQWMKYIIDLDKRTQGHFMLPESLKNNLYKKYSLDSKNDEEYLPSPPKENQDDFNTKEPKKPSNTNGSKLKGFNIKEHLVWIIPLALILPLGAILLPILIIRLKKTKKSFLSENDDNLNNKNNSKEETSVNNAQLSDEEVMSSSPLKINDVLSKLLKKKENNEEPKN